MVISVFPDVSQGFARYEQSRRGRLQDQALRTQNNMMQRRQAAFQDMVAGLEGQERTRAEAMGLDYVPFAIQQDAAQQAAAAEAAAAAREQQVAFLEDWGGRYARERVALGDEFDENAFMRNARVAATTSGVPMSRPDDPNALPEAIRSYSTGVEVDSQRFNNPQRGVNPETGREEFFVSDPTTGQPRFIGVQAPPRGSSAADAVLGILASQLAPASGDGADQANAARAVLRFGGSIGNIREQAEEVGPSGFGVAGGLRRGAQNISQQLLSASGMSIDNLRSEALGLAQSGQNPDPELAERVRSMFDPNLSSLGPAAILLAYQAAEAVAGQSGRALSDNDFRRFLDVIGDPGSLFSTYDGFMSRLDLLDREVLNAVNAERTVAGMPSIPRSMRFSDGSALEWLSAAPEDRAAVVDRYSERGDQTAPRNRSGEGESGNGGPRRRTYVPGQGFRDG